MSHLSASRGGLTAVASLLLCAACHRGSGAGPAAQTLYFAPLAPVPSSYAPPGVDPRISVPGLGDDFFLLPGAAFVETRDGSASFVGVLAREADGEARLAVRLDLADALKPGMPHYGERAQPRGDLATEAYAPEGGPVDVSTWRYYEVSAGEMRGLDALAGTFIALSAADSTGLQCGPGADNVGVSLGASVRLAASVQSQPESFAAAALDGELTLAFALGPKERTYAASSPGDAALGGAPRPALVAPGLGGEFELLSEGACFERGDGTLEFDAVLVSASDPAQRYALTLVARGRADAAVGDALPAGSPHLELLPGAYRAAGGPVDTATWRTYRTLDGRLRGLDALRGAEVRVLDGAFALQLGVGAAGLEADFGAAAGVTLEVLSQPFVGPALPWQPGDAVLRVPLRRAWVASADEPLVDTAISLHDGAALRLPGVAPDLQVVAGGEFSERQDGVAELRAELVSAADANERWVLELRLSGRTDLEDGGVPAGSPVLALDPATYAALGGPVDPDRWHYYALAEGRLRGLEDRLGAELALTQAASALQIGQGANNANLRFGMSGPLAVTLLRQPDLGPLLPATFADAELALTIERYGDRCAQAAQRDAAFCLQAGSFALRLPGVAADLVLAPGSTFQERADGTARLAGTLVRAANPAQRLLVELTFAGRRDAGELPPAGSPSLDLLPQAYAFAGGPVDPAGWHYYPFADGSLIGLGAWTGATLRLEREGPALQVGTGATGRNLGFGAAGGVGVTVISQPDAGGALTPTGAGELRFNLFDTCP